MGREQYVFRREWLDYMAELEPDERMEVREAIDLYAFEGRIMENMSRVCRIVFNCIKVSLDEMHKSYDEKAVTNRENGKKGGRPRKPTKTDQNPENPVGYLGFSENPEKPNESEKTHVMQCNVMQCNVMQCNENYSSAHTRGEAADAEKEKFYEVAFWRNWRNPQAEVERFLSYNSRMGWKALNTPEKRKKALETQWKPQDAEPRVNGKFLSMWRRLYDRLSVELPHVAGDMLHDGCRCSVANGAVVIHAPESVRKYIDGVKPPEVRDWAHGSPTRTTWP